MAELLGAAGASAAGGAEACGSPGEVANEPALGHHFAMYMTEYARGAPEVFRSYSNGMAKKVTRSGARPRGTRLSLARANPKPAPSPLPLP